MPERVGLARLVCDSLPLPSRFRWVQRQLGILRGCTSRPELGEILNCLPNELEAMLATMDNNSRYNDGSRFQGQSHNGHQVRCATCTVCIPAARPVCEITTITDF